MKKDDNKAATPAERLNEALALKNMKPSELSEKSGVAKSSISSYLSGKYGPNQSSLYRMSKTLDVNEMWLAGYNVPMERPMEQKQTDAMVALTKRMRNDEEFKELILRISTLNEKKVSAIRAMVASWESQDD